jgi:hypothetical protein
VLQQRLKPPHWGCPGSMDRSLSRLPNR